MFRKLSDRLLDHVEDAIVREATRALSPHINNLASDAMDAIINSAPKVKSTGGATGIYIKNIKRDFQDFHEDDANLAIATFVYEYLEIQCGHNPACYRIS